MLHVYFDTKYSVVCYVHAISFPATRIGLGYV